MQSPALEYVYTRLQSPAFNVQTDRYTYTRACACSRLHSCVYTRLQSPAFKCVQTDRHTYTRACACSRLHSSVYTLTNFHFSIDCLYLWDSRGLDQERSLKAGADLICYVCRVRSKSKDLRDCSFRRSNSKLNR